MNKGDLLLALGLLIAAVSLAVSAAVRCKGVKHQRARRLCAKTCVFLAGIVLWPALFVLVVGGTQETRPLVLLAFFIVLGYLGLELRAPYGYAGSVEGLDGSAEFFFERGTQVTTVAFALGTLLVSQKDAELARIVAPLVFLALFFAIIPSLAVGQTARRHLNTSPVLGAVQRLALSFAAGLLCVSMAVCIDHIRVNGYPLS
jgi:nitrate reductase NapE component